MWKEKYKRETVSFTWVHAEEIYKHLDRERIQLKNRFLNWYICTKFEENWIYCNSNLEIRSEKEILGLKTHCGLAYVVALLQFNQIIWQNSLTLKLKVDISLIAGVLLPVFQF